MVKPTYPQHLPEQKPERHREHPEYRGHPQEHPTIPADPATGLPAGFEYKDVTLGGSDKDYIAIIDGVKEGDVVAVLNTAGMMGPFGPGSGAVTESGE